MLSLLSSCGVVQTYNWIAFADSMGAGSEVVPAENLFNLKGDIEVSITKSVDPLWNPHVKLEYPYAGILMQFWRSGKSVDLSTAEGLTIEYRLEGNISMRLVQENILEGKEYQIELPPQRDFNQVHVSWKDFRQPPWIEVADEMDLIHIVGLMFTNSAEKHSTAKLAVRQITFPGWNNPHSFTGQLRGLGNTFDRNVSQ